MNRVARSALALSVGFGGTAAVLRATNATNDAPTEPTVIGPMDVSRYCRSGFGDDAGAVLVGTNEYGWRCATRPNGLFELTEIDFDAACSALYGPGLEARNWEAGNAYAWECIQP